LTSATVARTIRDSLQRFNAQLVASSRTCVAFEAEHGD
jgi:hypothetical protein